MATINELGHVLAWCTGCQGAYSRFEFEGNDKEFGVVRSREPRPGSSPWNPVLTDYQYRLYRCVGCGMGALGVVRMKREGGSYPSEVAELAHFYPEAKERLPLPEDVPEGISKGNFERPNSVWNPAAIVPQPHYLDPR